MRMDSTQQARAAQGRHERSGHASHPSARQRRYARLDAIPRPLRFDRPATLLVAALLLVDLRNAATSASPPAPGSRTRDDGGSGAALLHSAVASRHHSPHPVPSLLPGQLSSLANGAIALCVASPRFCATALGATALLGTTAVLRASLPETAPSRTRPAAPPRPQERDVLLETVQRIGVQGRNGAQRSLQDVLLDIARECSGDRHCRAERINALLQTLPVASLATIQHMVDATADDASTSFPPGAEAMPVGMGGLEALAGLLADLYTPDVASYQDDLETIVRATRDGCANEADARRLAAIHMLLERDGHLVVTQRFKAPVWYDSPATQEATNLLAGTVDPHDASEPIRRLLLVAHGDVAGVANGSDGAYDNASGVAAVLHVLRQLDPSTFADGTRVQALVTSLEERQLLGSRAFLAQCAQLDDCPTLVINLDMVGRGGHNYVLSGSDVLTGHYFAGKPPMNLQAPLVSAEEQEAAGILRSHFHARGFSRQPADGTLLLTSDNLSFQNASLPTLALAQMSATDASALQDIQQARIDYHRALHAVDWGRHADHHEGVITLAPHDLAEYHQAQGRIDQLWERYEHLRRQSAHTSSQLIHTGNDRLHRVNPRMAVDFSNAVAAFVREWAAGSAADGSTLPQTL